jgi:hypothetical protein
MSPKPQAAPAPAIATARPRLRWLIGLAAIVVLGTGLWVVSRTHDSPLSDRPTTNLSATSASAEHTDKAPTPDVDRLRAPTNMAPANAMDATPRTLQLPSKPTVLEGAHLEALLVRYGLYDLRRNPTGKGVVHRYRQQVVGDAVVVSDAATGLMWQKRASSSEQNTFLTSRAYLDELNRTRFAGYTDWRMPTVAEAASLLEPKPVDSKYLDPVFTGGNFIWTADASATARGWVIYFYDGYAATEPFAFNATVRAVRSLDTR